MVTARAVLHERFEIRSPHGPGKVEALTGVATESYDLEVLGSRLNAFCHHGHVEVVGELDDGDHDGVAGHNPFQVGDE